MEIRKRFSKNIAVLYVAGSININSAVLIEETGQLLKMGVSKILCSCSNLNMVDYNGLSILAITYKNVANQNGILKFCNVPSHIKELFKVARLDRVFEMHENEELALKSFELSNKVDKLTLRRRFKRIDLSVPVKFKSNLSRDKKLLRGKILNLSGEGIFIHAKNTFPVSTDLNLGITLAPKQNKINIAGNVIWVADKTLQPHVYPGMGIKIVKLNPSIQDKIVKFIDKHLTSRVR